MTFKSCNPKYALLGAAVALGGMMFQSCSDENGYAAVDGQAPTITLATNIIHAEPGSTISIEGVASDADGLKSIRLKNDGMLLDKTINLLEIYGDSLLHKYDLSYSYTCAKTWTDDDNFPLEVTVEDVLGHTTTETLNVKGDGDYQAPTFTAAPSSNITVLVQNPKLKLNLTLADNKNLQSLVINIPDLNILDSITCSGKEHKEVRTYQLPDEEAVYPLSLRLYDAAGNKTIVNDTITVSELPDFDKMYLADVSDVASLNSDIYGVPMLIDHVGEYQYRAHYYNSKAGTGVRFIPQKTDFEPICFGPNEDNQIVSSPSEAKEIILPNVGYYEINFNTVSGEYSVKEWTPTTAAMTLNGTTTVNFNDGSGDQPAQICLAGAGLPGAGNWTTNQNNDAFILNQSTTNPYLLYREMKLEAGTEIEFTISQTHWWGWWPEPFWRFNGSDENEANVLNGGDNMKKMTVKTSGTYLFEFDYALLRSRITLVKAE